MGFWEFLLLAPVSLFIIVGPVSAVPIFLAMTPQDSPARRSRMARTACLVAGAVLLFFALTGNVLFQTLGVTMPAFQIAGGLFLFTIGFDLLRARESEGKISNEETTAGVDKDDPAITPLAVPLLAGPGAISTTILLSGQASDWGQRLVLWGSIILVMLLTYGILAFSARGAQWLSPLVLRLFQRLMGMILAALAVQFVINGLITLQLVPRP